MQDKLPVMGSTRLFNEEEERALAEHFDHMNYLGYGYIQKDMIIISSDYAVALDKKTLSSPCLSSNWCERFRDRSPHVKPKTYPTNCQLRELMQHQLEQFIFTTQISRLFWIQQNMNLVQYIFLMQ